MTLFNKDYAECQWTLGCTHKPLENRAYCEDHLWQVYQRGTNLGRRKKDLRTVDSVRTWQTLMDEAVAELEDEGYDFRLERWD